MSFSIEKMLDYALESGASDLHLSTGSIPMIRIHGEMKKLQLPEMDSASMVTISKEVLNNNQQGILEERLEIDLSTELKGKGRFRVNFFQQLNGMSAVFRTIPSVIKSTEELGIPPILNQLSELDRGLVLLTGPTGSGKSTTMAALIQKISQNSKSHIITIEDPIEYLYEHSESLVNQREVGIDTMTFASGLRSALRQDPDVVSIGELRDVESMSAALTIAETGHLVFGTLHTNNAAGTITRLVDAFPPVKQEIIRTNLSMSLLAIISQQLIPNNDNGRSLAAEVLINTQSIKALIRENNIHQIDNYILSGSKDGMVRMDNSILSLFQNNQISKEEALNYAINPNELLQKLNSPNI